MNKSGSRFSVPDSVLCAIPDSNCFVRKGRTAGLKVAESPHIIISSNYRIYSEKDFVIPNPRIGISSSWKDANYLAALSVLLNSSLIQCNRSGG